MRHNQNRNDPWYKCALYEVWRDMMRTGRRIYNQRMYDKTGEEFPVDPIFQDYYKFRLWACFCHRYKMGEMDDYRLARRDLTQGFSPENCYFTKEPFILPTEEDKNVPKNKVAVGKGAKATFKEKSAWDGLSRTRLYNIWKGMIRRCTDINQKDYKDYGARGITVCEEWKKDFLAFYNWAWDHGYNPDLSIDRMDVNGNYCPENCRWAGFLEQKLNTRAYGGRYKNLRLKVKEMRNILENMKDNVVVTLIAKEEYLPYEIQDEADYEPVPLDKRIDVEIGRRKRK